jgi:polyribonucleotide nucleotidyltransferase
MIKLAQKLINDIVAEAEVGQTYTGKVTRIMNFGAFVEILPGKEGLLHISHIAHERVAKVEDVLNIGDEVEVKVTEIDEKGRVNLSRKVLLPKPEKTEKKEESVRWLHVIQRSAIAIHTCSGIDKEIKVLRVIE